MYINANEPVTTISRNYENTQMTHSQASKQKSNISFDFSENNDNYKSYTPHHITTNPTYPAPPTPPPLRKLLKLFRQK